MKLEDQVCSLELAKKMKESGFDQDSSHFIWASRNNKTYVLTCNQIGFTLNEWKVIDKMSAYTVAELGEMLNVSGIYTSFCGSPKASSKIIVKFSLKEFEADTEANARAKMLIYLKENSLI